LREGRGQKPVEGVAKRSHWFHYRHAELTSKPYNVLGGTLNSAQSNQSFAVESIVVTKLLLRVNA